MLRAQRAGAPPLCPMSYASDGKTFLPWDPARPCRSHPCAHCGRADATKRCTRCTLAHYCGRECQQSHWGAHKAQCKAGVPAYLDRVAEQVRKQAALLQRADVAAEVVATLEETLALARAMGDAEGERHLTSTLVLPLTTPPLSRTHHTIRAASQVAVVAGYTGAPLQPARRGRRRRSR